MAERESMSEVLPYRFEPVSVSNYSDNEDSTSESETNIREQARFTERLYREYRLVRVREMLNHVERYRVSMLQGNGECSRAYCRE